MMKKMIDQHYSILFRMFHVAMLVCILTEGCGWLLGVQKARMWHWGIALFGVGILVIFNYGKARSKLLCMTMVIICLLMIWLFAGTSKIHEFFTSYAGWLIGNTDWNETWITGYELMQMMWIVLGCYLFAMLAERYNVLRVGTIVTLLSSMIACMLFHKEISHIGVVLALGYMVVCYVEQIQRFWKKKRERDTREYVLWLLPFCVLYVVLMLFMPVPEKPYDWSFVKETYARLQEHFTIWIETRNRKGQEDFGTAVAGFSEDGRLMSGMVDSDQELLTIQGSQGLVTNVYLVGKVYDTFDGRQWLQTVTEDTQERKLDTLETLYAIERHDSEIRDNYIQSTGLTIRYEHFDTGCVFAPLKLRYIKGYEYQENGGNLFFGEQMGYGTSYQAVYYQMNLNHPKFYEMAETEKADDEEIWKSLAKTQVEKDETRYTLTDLKVHQNSMKEIYYTEMELTEEAEDYLNEITKGAETAIEKLIAIEKELSAYTYTMNPGKLPETIESAEDFLEYFLLESKQGYCSYFATAFVLMARAEGIPARYVQGFCIPITSNKKMTVTSSMAHAWPEVYIEGIGWLPFEPTPGYEELRYTPWEMREKKDYSSISMEEEEEKQESIESEVAAEMMEEEESKVMDKRLLRMLLIGGLMFLLACIMVLCIDQWLFLRRYERMTVEERFLIEVRKNLWLLSKLGYTRIETETLEELQKRVLCGLSQAFEEKQELVFLRGYEEYLYRKKEVQEEVLTEAIMEREMLLQKIRQEKQVYFYTLVVRLRFVR